MQYIAYGLYLKSSFELLGTKPAVSIGHELPTLGLSLLEPGELEQKWHPAGPPEWRGRLGDGCDLVIEPGTGGDVLFTYIDPTATQERARFRLRDSMRQLDCAPRQSGLDWQRALIGKILPSIAVMVGYEALHAASVESDEGVVAIMAPSGTGKSTLAIELLRRGLPLFADDVLVLGGDSSTARAHPGTPHMNIALTADSHELGVTLDVLNEERWIAAHATTKGPREVRMLCLLERGPNLPLRALPLSPNPIVLAPYMLGLSLDVKRQRSRFGLYGDLLESATLIRLTAGLEHRPEQLADLVERALVQRPETAEAQSR